MKHLKTTLLAFTLLFFANALMAQEKYDYAILSYSIGFKTVGVAINGEEYKEIDISDMKNYNKSLANPALRELNKMEDEGWELFDTEIVVATYVFFLRRKEQ